MASYDHEHDESGHDGDGFEAGCPACELDEVSLQDTGRPWGWAARAMGHPSMRATRRHFATNPLPGQRQIGGAA